MSVALRARDARGVTPSYSPRVGKWSHENLRRRKRAGQPLVRLQKGRLQSRRGQASFFHEPSAWCRGRRQGLLQLTKTAPKAPPRSTERRCLRLGVARECSGHGRCGACYGGHAYGFTKFSSRAAPDLSGVFVQGKQPDAVDREGTGNHCQLVCRRSETRGSSSR